MAKFKAGDKVKYSAQFLKSTGQVSDRGRVGVVTDDPTGMPAGRGFISVKWNDESAAQPIQESALMKTKASFKGAVPGNLADNTKPSTPESQQYTVDLLKQGGILPDDQQAEDYPVLTARVKRDIIATLLRRKQPKLATWASHNLQTSRHRVIGMDASYLKSLMPAAKAALKGYGKVKGGGTSLTVESDGDRHLEFVMEPPTRFDPRAGWMLTVKKGSAILSWTGADLTGDKDADAKTLARKAKVLMSKWN